jgi:predicted nucleic acid-binding protein
MERDRSFFTEDKTWVRKLAGGNEMGKERTFVLIDTNVFVIDLRYKNDSHYRANRKFLDLVSETGTGFTTVINLLEICGILSFNLSERQLRELWFYFPERYKVTVLPDTSQDSILPSAKVSEVFDLIKERMSFGDAYILAVANKTLPSLATVVTWDKNHFQGKFPSRILTPAEYLSLF